MSTEEQNLSLTPWAKQVPSGWQLDRLGNVAEILFSNVDKHTLEEEEPVRLCNYVDVYKNEHITATMDFMEASAVAREIERFQVQPGDVIATKDSETPDDIAISSLVVDVLPKVLCGYHLALMRPRKHKLHGPYLAWLHASKAFRAQYEAKAVGVTRWGLAQSAFKETHVLSPHYLNRSVSQLIWIEGVRLLTRQWLPNASSSKPSMPSGKSSLRQQ